MRSAFIMKDYIICLVRSYAFSL